LRNCAWLACALLCACLLFATFAQAANSKRLALVIGNDAYQNVGKLEKAGNDATAMARELKAAGFDVTLERDVNFRSMVRKVEQFTSRVSGGDQVVVFYAGHGVQLRTGSYLLPVDIEANSESEVEKTSYALNDLMDKLSDAKAAFSLVMVDACRDNPLKSNGRSFGTTRGLLPPDPPKGQMVVYSASKGQQALDKLNGRDSNPNGVFTREFIARMKKPGIRIEELVREVQDAVEDLARTVGHDQRPAMYNESRGNFYFFGPTSVVVGPSDASSPVMQMPARAPELIDDDTWEAIKDTTDAAILEEYIRQYPKGRHVAQARVAIAKVKAEAKRAAAAPLSVATPSPAQVQTMGGATDAETALWQAASSGNSIDDYSVYIQQYPRGKYLPLAKQRIQKFNEAATAKALAEQDAAWQVAADANSVEGYQAYAKRFPAATNIAVAQAQVNSLREAQARQEESQQWLSVQKGTSAEVALFLQRYPTGAYVTEAGALLERLRTEELEMRPGKVFKDCADCPEMVVITEGSFVMGGAGADDEMPTHRVNIKRFALGRMVVTRSEWQSVMGSVPGNSRHCGASCPVVEVNWNDAQEFIQKLNTKSGKKYRLPSEAEWEYACRAGTSYLFCGTDNKDEMAWNRGNSFGSIHPVGEKQPNAFGLYDMNGNAWQWVEDWYHNNYLGAPTDGSAWIIDGEQKTRVLRGGAWDVDSASMRAGTRFGTFPEHRNLNIGFRIAQTLSQP